RAATRGSSRTPGSAGRSASPRRAAPPPRAPSAPGDRGHSLARIAAPSGRRSLGWSCGLLLATRRERTAASLILRRHVASGVIDVATILVAVVMPHPVGQVAPAGLVAALGREVEE